MIKAKLLEFGLKNWKELLVIVSLSLVAVKTRMDYNALNKAYEISQNELELQIDSLKEIHATELAQRDAALDTYRNTLEEIERNYLESQEDLEEVLPETAPCPVKLIHFFRWKKALQERKKALKNLLPR